MPETFSVYDLMEDFSFAENLYGNKAGTSW